MAYALNRFSVSTRARLAKPGRLIAAILLWSLSSGHAGATLSQQDVLIYQAAFEAASLNAWESARQITRQATDPVLEPVLDWVAMSNADGDRSYADIVAFIETHPDWPDQTGLRAQAELLMPAGLPIGDVIAWFDARPPVTVEGTVRFAEALNAVGRQADAATLARTVWTDIRVSEQGQQLMLAQLGGLLTTQDHIARLDNLLWSRRESEARRLMPLLDAGYRALAEARIQLANRAEGVNAIINTVPASLRNDEGLLYERLRWRRRANLNDGAMEMLALQPAVLARPDRWWTERNILARRQLSAGNPAAAYAIAAGHRQTEGFPRSQAEWLSGWLALRFLNDPERAFGHFQALYDNVGTPISLGRGAYWSGRALETMGRTPEATQWYETASRHDTAFYGQLAADRLGRPTVAALAPDPALPSADAAAIDTSAMANIVRALDQIGESARADLFLRQMARNADGDPATTVAVARLALALNRAHVAVWAVKQLIFDGVVIYETGYPTVDLSTATGGVEPALLLALMRRESEFDIGAVSPAGARGLMQLMPTTANAVAGQIGVAHNTTMLTSNPGHNIRLGSSYLASLINRFDGSYILAIAGYNAGPGRVDGWLETLGDPRRPGVDIIDWVESIPIYETRNYVMRVLEDLQVYRIRLGGTPTTGALEADLAR